jgi:hypothetical protein
MELQDLKDRLKVLEQEYESKQKEVMREYCDENNPYKIGDKFTDHIGTILIEKILYSYYNSFLYEAPSCVYFGPELKKDGTPKKNGDKRKAYQLNDIKKG